MRVSVSAVVPPGCVVRVCCGRDRSGCVTSEESCVNVASGLFTVVETLKEENLSGNGGNALSGWGVIHIRLTVSPFLRHADRHSEQVCLLFARACR